MSGVVDRVVVRPATENAKRPAQILKSRLLCSAVAVSAGMVAMFSSSSAHAQSAYLPVLAGPVVGGVAGVPLHLSGYMDVVPGPSMAIVAAEVTGFETVGGSGSGGGGGLGGALFVGSGAIVNITSSRFTNNVARGGTGGVPLALTGGSLNGGGIPNPFGVPVNLTAQLPGIPGLPGITPYGQTDQFAFGDGFGNGLAGTNGMAGFSAGLVPFAQGGMGGMGGTGQNGWATNPLRIDAVTDATQELAIATQEAGIATAQQTISIMMQTADSIAATADVVEAAASAAAAVVDPAIAAARVARLVVAIGTNATVIAADALQLTNDAASIAVASQSVTLATQQLTQATQSLSSWIAGQAAGIYARGGEGGRGGQGGAGGFGASGGPGGNGGNGGVGMTPMELEADGGNGGNAGISGFGAGGAQGGNGGFAGMFGVAGGSRGLPGAGGIAGFGGGVGSSGTGLGVDVPTGGGGGSGLGGAIFVQTGGTVLINGQSTFMGNSAIAGQSLNGGPSGFAAGNSIFLHGTSQLILGATPLDVVTFVGPQSIADNSAIGAGGFGYGSVTVASGLTVMAPGTSNAYAGTTTVGSFLLNPLSVPGEFSAVLRANDGDGLPHSSLLNFTAAGILETNQAFNRYVGDRPGDVQWTGSGGFAYWDGVVTGDGSIPSAERGELKVSLSNNQPLFWGAFGFVPVGSALVFGSPTATGSVHFTNSILTGLAGLDPLTSVKIVVVRNKAQTNVLETDLSIPENIDYLKYTGKIIGLGGVSFNDLFNDGTIYLLDKSAYVGPTYLYNGNLILQGRGEIAPTMLLDIVGEKAVFDITTTDKGTSVGGLAGVGTVRIGDKPFAVTAGLGPLLANFGGTIEGSATFTVKGGHQRLSGLNTYTGVTTIDKDATLDLAGDGSILSSVGVVNNGLFAIGATNNGASITTMSGNGLVALGSKYLTLTTSADTFAGSINGEGGVILEGGTLTLTGDNGYSGFTDVKQGTTLNLADGGAIARSAIVNVDGTLDLSATTNGASFVSLAGAGSVQLGEKSLALSQANHQFDGVISGSGGLSVQAGAEVLTAAQAYTGKTSIDAEAVLGLRGNGAINLSSGVANDGLFDISQTTNGAAITTLSGNGIVNLGDVNLNITAADDEFAGIIGGNGGLSVTGGKQVLSGTNLYNGVTTVGPQSTLALRGKGSIATSAGVVVDGLFDISETTEGAAITTLSGSGTVDLGGQTLTLTAAKDTFAGSIVNSPRGSLTVAAGQATLSGVNTYTGQTTVAADAALVLAGEGAIAQSDRVLVDGYFDISGTGAGASITTLAGNGLVNLGSKNLTVTAGADTFAGVIGGAGGLAVTGGSQTLSGVNVFAGQASVAAGATLALDGEGSIANAQSVTSNGTFDISKTTNGAAIRTLAGSGTVELGERQLTLTAASSEFSGSIAGNGALAVTSGHATLSGASTYTGGTLVDRALLTVNTDAALGDANGTLTLSNAVLETSGSFVTGRSITLASTGGEIDTAGKRLGITGVVSGEGTLFATGGGRIDLTGANTYAGGTTITEKTIVSVNGDGALGDTAGAVRILDGKLQLTGNLFSNRDYFIGKTSTIEADGNRLEIGGPIYLEQLGWRKLFDGSVKASGGAWTLTPTMLTLAQGTTLGGVGTVTMATTVNGLLKPGNSPGTLAFGSSLTLSPTATLAIDIDGRDTAAGAGSFSRVLVTGSFAAAGTIAPRLRGITGSASNTFTPKLGDSFAIAQAQGGITGSFSGLTQPAAGLPAGTRIDALYSPNTLSLHVVPISYRALQPLNITLTANQLATAGSLDALRPVPGVRTSASTTDALLRIYALDAKGIAPQLDHLAPTAYGDALVSAAEALRETGQTIDDQVQLRHSKFAGVGTTVARRGETTWWMSGANGDSRAQRAGQTSVRSERTDLVLGADRQLEDNLLLGFAFSYSDDDVRSQQTGARVKSDIFGLSAYLGWLNGNLSITSRAGLSYADYRSQRSLYSIANLANGNKGGLGASSSTTIGYRIAGGNVAFIPEAALDFAMASRGELTEQNAGAVALNVNSSRFATLHTRLGTRVEVATSLGDGFSLAASAKGYWAHNFGDRTDWTTAAFVNAPNAPMFVTSVYRERDSAVVGASLSLQAPGGLTIWGRYNTERGGHFRSSRATAGLRWQW